MAKQIGFHFGILAEPIEKQANEQGFTLGDMAEDYTTIIDGIILAWYQNILTDSEFDKAKHRLMKKIIKDLKLLKELNNNA